MTINQNTWDFWQSHLGYTDEEAQLFRENPRNEDVLAAMAVMSTKTIIIEVIKSHGCLAKHTVGTQFILDGGGYIITKRNPERICPFIFGAIAPMLCTAQELFYAGLDPNEMRFKTFSCPDVGIQCGGWGNIVMEMRVIDRD